MRFNTRRAACRRYHHVSRLELRPASMVNEVIIIAALSGAIIWNLITWWFGMPSSSSHALVGGIIGAVIFSVGFMGLNGYGILNIFLSLVLSPIVALVVGWITLHVIFAICHSFKPATVNDNCNRLQVVSGTRYFRWWLENHQNCRW